MPTDNPIAPPEPVVSVYRAWRWTAVSSWPHQTTWRLLNGTEVRYLKVGRTGNYPGLVAEAARTRWATTYLPVPDVVDADADEDVEWLVTAGIAGKPANEPGMGPAVEVVVAWAEGLRRFHELAPASTCPFRFGLDVALEHVRARVAAGLVDVEDFNDDHRYLDSPERALEELERLRPDREDLVVSHGDYCPPNALLLDGRLVGYVDLGELGLADRWRDVAVGTWSTTWNFGPGLETLFLEAYGAEPNSEGQAFYRLLYDLAS